MEDFRKVQRHNNSNVAKVSLKPFKSNLGIMLVFHAVFVGKLFCSNPQNSFRNFLSEVNLPKLFRPKIFDFNLCFSIFSMITKKFFATVAKTYFELTYHIVCELTQI